MRTDQTRCLVHLRQARPSANGAPAVFPHLRARRSWRPWVLALLYPACFVAGAVVALGARP